MTAFCTRLPPTNNLLTRLLRPLRHNRRPPRTSAHRKPTSQDWRDLIEEFEQRARTRPPPVRTASAENPAQYRWLPHTESAFMVALTTVMWYFGRIFRLDAFLLLLYPLPNIYIAARHGLTFSNYTLASTMLLVFSLVGPLYAVLYFLNTGLLTMAYARTLWYRFPWWLALLSGGLAKTAGLGLQLWFMSGILRVNPWKAIGMQVSVMLQGLCSLLGKIGIVVSPPGMTGVYIGIGVVVAVHSFYHVFFTLMSSTLILRRVAETEDLVRVPPDMPLVKRFMRRVRGP